MFDEYTRKLIDDLPTLEAFDSAACRRLLTTAYAQLVSMRLQLSGTDQSREEVAATVARLRRLADALESVAVFDPLSGIEIPPQSLIASAFVAAESLALVRQLQSGIEGSEVPDDVITHSATYVALESALLYMIGGYDINAVSVLQPFSGPSESSSPASSSDVFRDSRALRDKVIDLCRGRISSTVGGSNASSPTDRSLILEDVLEGVRALCYRRMTSAIDRYFLWLSGDDDRGLEDASISLRGLMGILVAEGANQLLRLSDLYHLTALILAAINRTSSRSIVHKIPPPEGADEDFVRCFKRYLRDRAVGTRGANGRPYMWPSALEYCEACLPGPHSNAVVSLPTGSGKSFVAEIAIAHALSSGWVLYLAPTNALVEQIRKDLKYSLHAFKDLDTLSFTSGSEYVDVAEDRISSPTKRVVAVMTPEKCALLLRTAPESFSNCALCVFDECHLLRDKHRGVTADIVMAQVFRAAPNAKVLLMSAMMSNPDELAGWLNYTSGGNAAVPRVKWRPSRTARGFVVVDVNAALVSRRRAEEKLKKLPPKRARLPFSVPLSSIIGLSGPWTADGPDDYAVVHLSAESELSVERQPRGRIGISSEGWKNDVGRTIAERFALHGVPAINFLLSSKHHPFSQADRAAKQAPFASAAIELPPVVDALLEVAALELGTPSLIRTFLRSGIAVHTSAMLAVEREASEYMFARSLAKLMFATGTLAQGLNLPAIAVVISGTIIGDPREAADPMRTEETILNAFGRAGRPGFSNQGIVFLVGDNPVLADGLSGRDLQRILHQYPVLEKADAAVGISSPIEALLDQFSNGEAPEVNALELELTSVLAGQGEDAESRPWTILRRTLAAYQHRHRLTPDKEGAVNDYVTSLKKKFIDDVGVPPWLPRAAMIAGVNIRRAVIMWDAISRIGAPDIDASMKWTVAEWLHYLVNVLCQFPPAAIEGYRERSKRSVPMVRLENLSAGNEAVKFSDWTPSSEWCAAWRLIEKTALGYMRGESYANMARELFDNPSLVVRESRSVQAVIPYMLSFVDHTLSHSLAIDAGCLLALLQEFYRSVKPDQIISEALRILSFCVRNGCDRPEALVWHRLVPYRVCAHALANRFPIPEDLAEGQDRVRWAMEARDRWLGEDNDAAIGGVLRHAKLIMNS